MASPSTDAHRPLDFARAFRFVPEDPDWIKKILIGGAFTLLSAILIGAPFVMGYFVRLVRNVARGDERPLPEWDDLGGIFSDGLRAVVVYLAYLVGAMILPVTLGGVLLLVMAGGSSSGGGAGEALASVAALAMVAIYALGGLLMLVLMLFVPAALLRFILYDRVSAAFEVREVVGIIQRNVGSYLLALVLYFVANMASQIGIVLCCVGVFPLGFWSFCILAWGLGEVARRDPVLTGTAPVPAY
jgi:Protein of unknown function (DUF4013)